MRVGKQVVKSSIRNPFKLVVIIKTFILYSNSFCSHTLSLSLSLPPSLCLILSSKEVRRYFSRGTLSQSVLYLCNVEKRSFFIMFCVRKKTTTRCVLYTIYVFCHQAFAIYNIPLGNLYYTFFPPFFLETLIALSLSFSLSLSLSLSLTLNYSHSYNSFM
jgi:hypothetical protein